MKAFLFLLSAIISTGVFATPVNINTADAQTIADSLEGIALKKAQAIVDYRTKNGPFKSVDEINNVSGIGDKILEKIKADILLNTVAEKPTAKTIAEHTK